MTSRRSTPHTPASIAPALPAAAAHADLRAARIASVADAFDLTIDQVAALNPRGPCFKCEQLLRDAELPELLAMWIAAVQAVGQIAPLTPQQLLALRREFAVKTFAHTCEVHRCMEVIAAGRVVVEGLSNEGRTGFFIDLTRFHAQWNEFKFNESRLFAEHFVASLLTAVRLHFELDRNSHADLQRIHIDWDKTVKPDDALLVNAHARLMEAAEGRGLTIALLNQVIEQLPCVRFQRICGLALLRRHSRQLRTHPQRERQKLESDASDALWRHFDEATKAIHLMLLHRFHEFVYSQCIAPFQQQRMMPHINAVHNPPREHDCEPREPWNVPPPATQRDAAVESSSIVAQAESAVEMPPPTVIPRAMQRQRQQQQPAQPPPSPIAAAAASATTPQSTGSAVVSARPSPRGVLKPAASSSTPRSSFKSADSSPRRVQFDPTALTSASSLRVQPSPAAQSTRTVTPMTPIAEERLRQSRDGQLIIADRLRRQSGAPSDDMMDASPRDDSTPLEHREAVALHRELQEAGESAAPSVSVIKIERAAQAAASAEAAPELAQEELPSDEVAEDMATTEPQPADEQTGAANVVIAESDASSEISDGLKSESAPSSSQDSPIVALVPTDAQMQEPEEESAVPAFLQLEDSPPPSPAVVEAAEPTRTSVAAAAAVSSSASPASIAPSPLPMRRNVVLRQTQASPLRVPPMSPFISSSQPLPSRPAVVSYAQRRVTANPMPFTAASALSSAHIPIAQCYLSRSSAAAASTAASAASSSSSVAQIMSSLARDFAEIDDEHEREGRTLKHAPRTDPLQECDDMLKHWKTLLHDLQLWFSQHPPREYVNALPSLHANWLRHFAPFVEILAANPPLLQADWINAMRWLLYLLRILLRNSLASCLGSAGEVDHHRLHLQARLATLRNLTENWKDRCELVLAASLANQPAAAAALQPQPQPIEVDSQEQTGVQIEDVTEEEEN